jgi:hypothetical protein
MLENRRKIAAAVMTVLVLPVLIFGQGYVQQMGTGGNVDWTNQIIRATGIGAPNPNMPIAAQRAGAIKAAESDALRNLIATVKGVNLTSETLVENAMLTSDVITTKVSGAIRGYRKVDTRYLSTGDVEVEIEVPMTGILLDALLPMTFGGGALMTGLVCPTCGQPWPAGKPIPPELQAAAQQQGGMSTSAAAGGIYTGLIIDARGLGLRPAMAPKVVDEQGEEIYGSRFVSREYAVDIGMVGYEKDINRAQSNERVTNNPLIVKGLKVSGPNKTDVVIGADAAASIHNAAANMNFLQHCKVMFVLD